MIDLSDPEVFFEDHLLPKKTSISTLQITLNKYNLWIEWRRYSLQYRKASSKSNPDDELGLENTISLPYSMYPSDLSFPIFKNIYERFLIARWDYARILFEFDQKRNLKTLDILSEKSAFVIRIYRIWESTTEVRSDINRATQNVISEAKNNKENAGRSNFTEKLSFARRWMLDIISQIALLTCRLLAECESWHELKQVSHDASRLLMHWTDAWIAQYDKPDKFSPLTARYQLIALSSWNALADLNCISYPKTYEKRFILNMLTEFQDVADRYDQRLHPLFLYVRSQYNRKANLHHESVNDLFKLLAVTETFDSKSYKPIDFDLTMARDDWVKPKITLDSEDPRTRMYHLERVSGQQQFEYFIDPARIFEELAMSFKFLGDERACITNYLNALTWSPYKDMDMSHFISLANHLIRIDRFEEALAVVEEAKSRIGQHTTISLRSSTLVTLDTLESVLATRLGNYGEALENALKIAQPTDVMEANKPSSAIQEKSASRSPNPFQLISEKFDNLLRTDASSDQESNTSNSIIPVKTFIKDFIEKPISLSWYEVTQLFQYLLHYHSQADLEKIGASLPPQHEWLTFAKEYLYSAQTIEWVTTKVPDSLKVDPIELSIARLMLSRIRTVAVKGAYSLLYQACELYNNIAYNLAQLEIRLDEAIRYVTVAIMVMENLRVLDSHDRFFEPELFIYTEERLAQYYDTLAWIHFRLRDDAGDTERRKYLGKAIYIWENKSLVYGQNFAMTHYHLTRTYISLTEEEWTYTLRSPELFSLSASMIRSHLRRASHHWNLTNRLDVSRRLETELRLYRTRIDEYASLWKDAVYKVPVLPEKQATTQQSNARNEKPKKRSL